MEDTKEVRGRCIRPSVRIVNGIARSLLSLEKIDRYIAGIVFPNTKKIVVKRGLNSWLGARLIIGRNIRIVELDWLPLRRYREIAL
jgi:hypothetical protein